MSNKVQFTPLYFFCPRVNETDLCAVFKSFSLVNMSLKVLDLYS